LLYQGGSACPGSTGNLLEQRRLVGVEATLTEIERVADAARTRCRLRRGTGRVNGNSGDDADEPHDGCDADCHETG
jgi:hypothetical protein